MSTFLISAGGTGGHLSPGIALAEGLRARGHSVVLLISRKQVDARLSEKYPHFRFERMPGTGFSWRPALLVRCGITQLQACWFCLGLLRRLRPQGVVGFGGFTSAPLVLAAALLGVPAALHESNRVPGLAVRTLGRLARRVYLPPGVGIRGIRPGAIRHVGQPVRREFGRIDPAAARAAFGFSADQPLLVVLGGSQGASVLNDWARERLELLASEGIQLCVVTGLGKGEEITVERRARTGSVVRARFLPFCDRMAELMSAADLVISRAGAGTLAELIRCVTPAILVPYPLAADNHQAANAACFERQGGGIVLAQSQLGQLHAEVLDLIGNDWLLRRLRTNLQRMDRANALEFILADLEELTPPGSAPRPLGIQPA